MITTNKGTSAPKDDKKAAKALRKGLTFGVIGYRIYRFAEFVTEKLAELGIDWDSLMG